MNEKQIKEMVLKNYEEGYHCAEAIYNTIYSLFGEDKTSACETASGFCGGIGGCKEDVCGALSGGIIALGALYGRKKGGEDISRLVSLSAELRQRFVMVFKTTVCRDVIDNLDTMPEYDGCRDLTAKVTWMLYNLIRQERDETLQ